MNLTLLDFALILFPAILVAAIVYFLFRQFLNNRLQVLALEKQASTRATVLPLKLQAYERLTLLFERLAPANLIVRLKTHTMDAQDLRSALILAIQQEYEHNVSQQLYVSDRLWEIIKLAKNQYIEIISQVAGTVDPKASSDELANKIIQLMDGSGKDPVETAKRAIKKEAGLLL